MDFAAEICESCGEQFCDGCLVFPRGPKGPPFCTHCAMALSGVRNRRPVKPLGRGEIRRRRKALRANLAEDRVEDPIALTGTDLINGPDLEAHADEEETESNGILGRFRRRRTDNPQEGPDASRLFEGAEPVYETTVAGGRRAEDPPLPSEGESADSLHEESDTPPLPEHSSATALLNQLRESEGSEHDDDVWLPSSTPIDAPTWSLPDVSQQSPLGANGPWGSVATAPAPPTDGDATDQPSVPPVDQTNAAPVFLTEAQLKAAQRAQGPADKDDSGNWVPPSLRGMDPKAGTNGGELTKRRRRTPTPVEPETVSPEGDDS